MIAACQVSVSITDSQSSPNSCHRVRNAIQPSHLLWSPSPPAPNPSQHQSLPMSQLIAWGGQSTGVSALASVLPKKSQGWSPSEWTGWISLQSKGLSRVFSNTTVRKHQFFGTQPSSQSNSHNHIWLLERLRSKTNCRFCLNIKTQAKIEYISAYHHCLQKRPLLYY